MDEQLIKIALEDIQIRCPNATLVERKWTWQITLSSGASAKQMQTITQWKDFCGIDVIDGKLVISFDK